MVNGKIGYVISKEKEDITKKKILKENQPSNIKRFNNLNESLINSFISGKCNSVAKAGEEYVKHKMPSILMVYGGVGLGKTHLIQSMEINI